MAFDFIPGQPPEFVDLNVQTIVDDIIEQYENTTGTTLEPAAVERFIINTMAYRIGLSNNAIQSAAEQNLVAFAQAPQLDYLGELVGVTRLPAAPAVTTLEFTLVFGHGAVIIPGGTRVQSVDGQAVFQTLVDVPVDALTDVVQTQGQALTAGTAANGYTAGQVDTILDALAFVDTVANVDTTAGGADDEDDDGLRERIRQAPASFSNAGSKGAYRFHALSANPSIIDVAVTSPVPGQVNVYPLMEDGSTTPQQILDAVNLAVNAENVRPLTDTVLVLAPDKLDYTLDVELTILVDADATDIVDTVTQNLEAYTLAKRQTLGQDITASQVIAESQVDGVYSVDLPGFSDIIVSETQYPFPTAINVTVTGTTTG